MRHRALLASSVLAFAACVASQFQDGQFTCDPAREAACPPGLICAQDGVCRAIPLDAEPNEAEASAPEGSLADVGIDTPSPDAGTDACATAMWSSFPDARTPFGVAFDPSGRLFTTGLAGSRGWVAELDPCDGRVLNESTYAVTGATDPTRFQGIAATGTDVVVTGSLGVDSGADGVGLFGRIDPSTLQEREPIQAFQGAGISVLAHIIVASDGATWIGGLEHGFDVGNQKGWLFRITGSAVTPGFVGTDIAGFVDVGNGKVYALADDQGPQVELIDTTLKASKVGPPITVGTSPTAWSIAGAQGKIYAGGSTNETSSNSYVFLGALDPTDGGWTTTTLDPNPTAPDQLLAIAFGSGALFIGVNQRADFANGTPTIYRYELPLAAGAKPTWGVPPFGAFIVGVRDVKIQGEAIFVAGAPLGSPAQGVIARCRASGECPH